MSNKPVTLKQQHHSFAIEISSAGRLWIGSPMARMRLREILTRWCDGHTGFEITSATRLVIPVN